jgi:23S rRNA pseudouridine2605 synthase
MRISHFLARCGVASRRKAEEIVRAGRVRLNGEVVLDLGRQVDPEKDVVLVDDKPIGLSSERLVLAMNKPVGVVVSRNDPQGKQTVYDILPAPFRPRAMELVYAGRLDFLTSGLLILTTDGELANRLTHPSQHLDKAYHVRIDRAFSNEELEELTSGVDLGECESLPCAVRPLKDPSPRVFSYEFVLQEGRNRQVRRMVEAMGAKVLELERVRVGGLTLEALGLRRGECRQLNEQELRLLEREP